MASALLVFQPPKFDWHSEDQQLTFEVRKGQITLTLRASNFNKDIWFATIVGYLGKEGYKRWNTLPILKDEEAQKYPEAVFKAIADTLEVSTSYWNHIDEMYSDIRQGEHESTDQLDQCIKNLVKICQYSTESEKLVHRTDLLFHVTKHFEVKKWVRLKKRREDVTYEGLLQHAKEHEMTVKDFNRHKFNGGTMIASTVDEIRTFRYKKGNTGNNHRAKGSSGKVCSKCNTLHQLRECTAFGKKCHKCGHKNHFSTCCRLKQKIQGEGNSKRSPQGRSTERHHRPKGRCSRSRSSRSNTRSAHSIKLNHDQLQQESTVKKMFNTIYRSKSMSSISNETDPDGRTKIVTILNIKLPHRDVIDNLQVKVDDFSEANILPLDSFRSMFPHAVDEDGYPVEGFLRGSRTNLECYDEGRLINHGSIKL